MIRLRSEISPPNSYTRPVDQQLTQPTVAVVTDIQMIQMYKYIFPVCITRLGQESDSFFREGGGGWGGVVGGSSADSTSTLLTLRIMYVCFTKCRRAGHSVCADDKCRHWCDRTATN